MYTVEVIEALEELLRCYPPLEGDLRDLQSIEAYVDRSKSIYRDSCEHMEKEGIRHDSLQWDLLATLFATVSVAQQAYLIWEARHGRCRSNDGVTGRRCGLPLTEADLDGTATCPKGHRQQV